MKPVRGVMPHSLECEASILGGIIIRNEVLALLPTLEIDDFYHPTHRVVFEAIRNLEHAGQPIDVVTLESEIERTGKLDAVGGIAFLGELALRVPTVENVEAYAKIVTEHRVSRETIMMLGEMVDSALSGNLAGEQLVHEVGSRLMTIRTGNDVPIVSMGDLIKLESSRVMADLDAKARGERVYAGVPTGFNAIDERCGGNPIGVSTLYVARPATGKTTFAMAMCRAAKEIADMDSLLASYEDSGQSFGQRGLAQETGVPTERIRARKLMDRSEIAVIMGAAGNAPRKRSESFMDCAGMPVDQLIRRVRRENLRRKSGGKKPLRQLVVDYIQKMPLPDWARTKDEGLGYVSMMLSTFASQEQMAVVIMSQLNRESEKRDDHRPRLSDIRDSGSLEQDGKMIYGIYHPHSYEPDKYPASQVYLLVLKNAQGESHGEIELYWQRETHAIYNSALDYQTARAMRGGR